MSVFTKKNSKIRLIVAMILTLLAGGSVYYYLTSIHQTVPVVVATRDLIPNTIIEASDVRVENISKDSKHKLAISDTKQVIGTRTKDMIYKDMQLISSQLSGTNNNSLNPGETLLPLKNVIASPGLRAGNQVTVTIVRPEGVFSVEGARIYQAKDNEVVLVADRNKVKQIIEVTVDARKIYVLLRR